MKYTVMTRILFMLLAKRRVTAKELSEKFSISQRSVYRYIDELSLAHVPITTERGQNGGIYITEDYKLPASFLSQAEYKRLYSLIEGLSAQMGRDDELSAICDKLFSATRKYDMQTLNSSALIIDGSGWNDLGGYNEKFSLISKAINETLTLSISYHDRDGQTSEREIEPHAIVLKHGVWYAYAFCLKRKDFRLFRIGRIERAELGSEFQRRPFDADHLDLNDWRKDAVKEDIELVVDPSIRSDIEDWLGVENVFENEDCRLIAKCCLPYDRSLVSEIMKFGKKIRVVKPEKLKKDILDNAKQLVKLYS